MPRFTGQNKKHTNPRWFLNESREFFQHAMGVDNRDEAIEAILDFEGEVYGRKVSDLEDLVDLSDEELAQKYASITDTEDYRNMIAKMKDDDGREPDEFDALPKRLGMGRRLEENITYKVIEDEDDGGPTVEIQGSDINFIEMVTDLEGKMIDFDDGDPPEIFNYSDMNGADDAEEAAEYMIQNGIAKHYVEAWARMNNLEATPAGGFN